MTLGEKISSLRAERQMSQGDLADALEVSRQSVSKWETDSSVPDLDKLIRLSDLFGVTLDELVRGESCPGSPEGRASQAAGPSMSDHEPRAEKSALPTSRLVVGGVLLAAGLLGELLLLLLGGLGGLLLGFFFAGPLLICGILCLTVRRRVGLWCCWTIYVIQQMYWTYATGITWQLVRWTPYFEPQMNYMRLAIGWVMLLARIALVVCSVCSFRTVRLPSGRRTALLLAAGWVVYLCLTLGPVWLPQLAVLKGIWRSLASGFRLAAGTALLIATLAAWRDHRDRKAEENG